MIPCFVNVVCNYQLIGLKSKEARDGQEEEPPDVSESVEAETSADIREATNAGTSQVPLYTDIEIILT